MVNSDKGGSIALKHISPNEPEPITTTLQHLRANQDLWYRIKVLLHDLHNISAPDGTARHRIDLTTDALYISAPYFTPEESVLIKGAIVSPPVLNTMPEFETLTLVDKDDDIDSAADKSRKGSRNEESTMTVETAITSFLEKFFEKRKASGDARPCGPHDMGSVYRGVFGITKEELVEEKFLGRLRRAGLGYGKIEGKDDLEGESKGEGKGTAKGKRKKGGKAR